MPASTIAPESVDREQRLAAAAGVLINGTSSSLRSAYRDVIVRAEGAYVWNAGGRRFIDNHMGFGAISVGHGDRRVNEAVLRAASTCDLNGIGPQAGEVELAERLCSTMPSADKVAFCTSGTDATLHAVHFARAATGRRRLLKFHGGYHGWHDQLAVGARFAPGMTPSGGLYEANGPGLVVEHVEVLHWNDLPGLRAAFEQHGDELAAAVCEPYSHSYGCVPAAPGFLEELRALCTKHGVVLVFDEVKTGFRYHPGGYQAICGVTPDVTAFAKAIANGYTLAGMACTDAVIDALRTASGGPGFSGTFNASPYALAAANVTTQLLADGGYEHMAQLGEVVRTGLRKSIAELGVCASVTGIGGSWSLFFRETAPTSYVEAIESDAAHLTAYIAHLRAAGIFNTPAALASTDMRVCMSTSREDVAQMLSVAHEALARIAGERHHG